MRSVLRGVAFSCVGMLAGLACAHYGSGEADLSDNDSGADSDAGADSNPTPSPTFGDGGVEAAPYVDPAATDVDVVLTADNAYSFGWGDKNVINTFTSNVPATLASDIFLCPIGRGPEAYTIPAKDAPLTAYLYIVAWSDYATTQGVIGQFKRVGGTALYTGDEKWEVCATGLADNTLYVSPNPGPSQTVVNQQIALCNAGTGDHAATSGGWVNANGPVSPGAVGKLVVGEDNGVKDAGPHDFGNVCQVDGTGKEGVAAKAHWMWYSATVGADPFVYQASASGSPNTTRMPLIFRLPATAIPTPPPH